MPVPASAHSDIVYLNGRYLPLQEATVSVCDRGFLFGDGVYEVITVYKGKPFALDAHLKRLSASLNAIQLPPPMNHNDWIQIITTLLDKNPLLPDAPNNTHQLIYLQVTRGADSPIRHHHFPPVVTPTIFMRVSSFTQRPIDEMKQGFKAITAEDTRWAHCHIKAITLLPNVLLMEQARQKGAIEALLLREGNAIEGAASNLFIVKNGTIITPPLAPHMLGGITRQLTLNIAKKNNIPYAERPITESALRQADELWVTASVKEILPITSLDDHPIGNGKTGALWHKMITLYRRDHPSP